MPDPFFRSNPFIASKFAVLPSPGSSGDETLSSDLVFLLPLECSLSEPLWGDFLDYFVNFPLFPLCLPSPPLFDLALNPSTLGSSERSPSPLCKRLPCPQPPFFFQPRQLGSPPGLEVARMHRCQNNLPVLSSFWPTLSVAIGRGVTAPPRIKPSHCCITRLEGLGTGSPGGLLMFWMIYNQELPVLTKGLMETGWAFLSGSGRRGKGRCFSHGNPYGKVYASFLFVWCIRGTNDFQ